MTSHMLCTVRDINWYRFRFFVTCNETSILMQKLDL